MRNDFLNHSDYDFGQCYQDLIPTVIIFTFALLFGSIKLLHIRKSTKNTEEKSLISKILFLLIFVLNILSSSLYILKAIKYSFPYTLIITLTANCIFYLTLSFAFFVEMRRDVLFPGLFFFWVSLFDLIRFLWVLKAYILEAMRTSLSTIRDEFIAVTATLVFLSLFFSLLCFSPRRFPLTLYGPLRTSIKKEFEGEGFPKHYHTEKKASIASFLTFSWLNPLLLKGFKGQLDVKDFYLLPKNMQCDYLTRKFDRNRSKEGISKLKKWDFLKLLFKSFGHDFYIGMAIKLFNDVFLFVNPILLKKLIEFVNGKSGQGVWVGYVLASLMLCTNAIMAFLLNHYFEKGFRVGTRLKAFLMDYLYKKSLQISSSELQKQKMGEIVNLMAVDSQNFLELLPYVTILWSGPLQIIIGTFLLYREIGVASFVGIGIMIFFIMPLNIFIVRKMKNLQKELMRVKDLRIKLTNEVISSMKIIKLYAWEKGFKEKVTSIRQKELKTLRKYAYFNCVSVVIWGTSALFVMVGAFVYYTKTGGELTAAKAFTSIALLNIIRFPLGMLPNVINSFIVAYLSLKRFVNFFNSDEVQSTVKQPPESNVDVLVKGATFFWDGEKKKKAMEFPPNETGEEVRIDGIEGLEIKRGELVMVIGPVGCGKTALLSAMLGELVREGGDLRVSNDVAYVAQTSWIQNASIRDNILFGEEMDRGRYNTVLKACCLVEDLRSIKGGESAEIGERGINLSGGQKQRIALARAVYSDKRLYFIDDVTSALDPHVARSIMKKCIMGLMREKTIIFNTNAVQFLKHADRIIVMRDGKVFKQGTYEDLKKTENFSLYETRKNSNSAIEATPEDTGPAEETEVADDLPESSATAEYSVIKGEKSRLSPQKSSNELIETEKKEAGKVKWKIYKNYIVSYGGPIIAVFIFVFYLLRQGSDYGTKRYIAFWTDQYDLEGNLGDSEVSRHILYFSLISLGSVVIVGLNVLFHTLGYLSASRKISANLLSSVLRAPMTFFDTTPRGRILNRFTSDIMALDRSIPVSFFHFFTCFFEVATTLIVISVTTPWFLLSLAPLSVLYYIVQIFFIRPTREIKRLSSIMLSPLYSSFQETLEGTDTIRAFNSQKRFSRLNEERINGWTRVIFCNFLSNRWLSLRLENMGGLVVFLCAVLIVLKRDALSGGMAGLALSYSMRFVGALNWMVRSAVMLESQIISIERIMEYTAVESEAELRVEDCDPKGEWPSKGEVNIVDLEMKYRPELPLILKGITCRINPNEKIGIVGRTGAGKSSLFSCIFRLKELSAGSIYIDGVDISMIGLHSLRSKLTIIPQDPVMFNGSMRFNIDPLEEKTDEEIWEALKICEIDSFVSSLGTQNADLTSGKRGLDFEVDENGSNLSGGERQLLCIARALLRRSKVLLLDEATSSIDYETDQKIQSAIRKAFADFTVLTIAHRLNTIMNSDRILVLDDGKVAEFESPKTLLENKKSLFYSVVTEIEEEKNKS